MITAMAFYLLGALPTSGAIREEFGSPPVGLELRVVSVAPPNAVVVELHNASSKRLRVFQEDNTWGVARWRLMRIRQGRATLFFQVLTHGFTINAPQFHEIPADSQRQQVLNLNKEGWHSTEPGSLTFSTGDLLVAFYDVPPTTEAAARKVWWGAATTSVFVP